MTARMKNPALVFPTVYPAILEAIRAAKEEGGVEPLTLHLVHQRASQINGCSYCLVGAYPLAKKDGETDERLNAVAAWRDTPFFTEAERAALRLAESMTRLSDQSDAVPDDVWDEVADHYDEKQIASLVLMISLTNFFNRINVTTRQPAGGSW
ncbi:carboxymuconolactone decarboxylase family protein [Streptomyces sp. NPDC001985]|uniref:carboxymuconolactone decarboxylase family protein n=1 Tax=Streptomyces sp. NPDC001985 TaxID=3154406 RepID=UPI00332ADA15